MGYTMQLQLSAAGLNALVEDMKDNSDRVVFRIGDLAKEFGVTLRALRFYEDRGLLNPQRSGSTRLYSAEDRQRLKLILLAKRFGFSLVEIQEILTVHDSDTFSRESSEKILTKFKGQISVLNEQRDELDRALEELDGTIAYLETML